MFLSIFSKSIVMLTNESGSIYFLPTFRFLPGIIFLKAIGFSDFRRLEAYRTFCELYYSAL